MTEFDRGGVASFAPELGHLYTYERTLRTTVPALAAAPTEPPILPPWSGWVGMDTIVILAEEDSKITTASEELETYLETITGDSWTIVTEDVDDIAIRLDIDTLAGYGDEAVRITTNSTGVLITGQTAMAVRHGAYILLELLGVRWFGKHSAWTCTPTSLEDIGVLDEIHEPNYYWRNIAFNCYYGSDALADWITRNRIIGAKFYPVVHSYGAILNYNTGWYGKSNQEKVDYGNAHPDYFLPNDRYPYTVSPSNLPDKYPWQLNPYESDILTMSVTYAEYLLGETCGGSGQYHDTYEYGAVPISPRDGAGLDPPHGTYQEATDAACYLTNKVATDLAASYPGILFGVYNYVDYSQVPSFSLEPNFLVSITHHFNSGNLTNKERIDGFLGKGVQVGYRDYANVWAWSYEAAKTKYDMLNLAKWLSTKGIEHYNTEAVDAWGSQGLSYYVLARLLWDSTLDVDALIDDFYTKAFGAASVLMSKFFLLIDDDDASMAHSFYYLDAAVTAANGDAAIIARIHQMSYWARFIWKYHNVGITNLSQADLEAFYTFVCMNRDNYVLDYKDAEVVINARLRVVDAGTYPDIATVRSLLEDFGVPTSAEATTWIAEGVAEFAGSLAVPEYIDVMRIDLEALGDDVTAKQDVMLIRGTGDIIVPSDGSETVTINAKCVLSLSIGWYSPSGVLLDRWEQDGAMDWTEHNFTAYEAGNYVIHMNRVVGYTTLNAQVDVPGRPASMVADERTSLLRLEEDTIHHNAPHWLLGVTQYFYVPEGTSSFIFESEVGGSYNVTGELIEPDTTEHAFDWDAADWAARNSNITINSPAAGLWTLEIDSINTQQYFWFRGIPPLFWHNPEWLLIEA